MSLVYAANTGTNVRSQSSERRNFIVSTDCMAKKIGSGGREGIVVSKNLPRGTLLEEHITDRNERLHALHKPRQIIATDLDFSNLNDTYCAVELNRLLPVSAEDAQLLLSVKEKGWRLDLLKTKLVDAKLIDVGAFVSVRLPDYDGLGVVLCKGYFPEYGKGILFGIKFADDKENVVRMREKMFSINQEFGPENCDTVVPFSSLRLLKSRYAESVAISLGSKLQQLSTSHTSAPPPVEHPKETVNENEPVNIGERVAWISNNSAEHGVVKWVGYFPGHSEMLAGIECDNPVGSGTGAYFDKVLFHVKSKHATFIPVCGLIREKDFSKPPSTTKKGGLFKRKKKKKETETQLRDHKPEHTCIKSLGTDSLKLKESLNPRSEVKNATTQSQVVSDDGEHQQIGTSVVHNFGKPQETESSQTDKLVDLSRTPTEGERKLSKYDAHDTNSLPRDEQLPSLTSGDNADHEGLVVGKLTLRTKSFSESQKRADNVQLNGTHILNDNFEIAKIDVGSLPPRTAVVQNKHEDQNSSTYPANSKRKSKVSLSPGVSKRSVSTPETDMDVTTLPPLRSSSRTELADRYRIAECAESPSSLMKSSNLHSKSTGSKLNSIVSTNELMKTSLVKRDSLSSIGVQQMPVEEASPDYDELDRSLGSTHSLTRNGYTSKSESQRNDFDKHDFLFGSDVGNKDVLDSFHSNDLKRTRSHSIDAGTLHFEVGSVVEVIIRGLPFYGVIQWIGCVPGYDRKVAGLEMEEEIPDHNCDGTFNTEQYFLCSPGKGFYVPLEFCQRDGRFLESITSGVRDGASDAGFGSIDCPTITGDVAPLNYSDKLLSQFGKNKGIQGHHNSCYLDATLFSMFTFTGVFDSILHRPSTSTDIQRYHEVQKVLKESIVNPLRQNLYVRADRVMKLRTLLEDLGSVSGLTCEEKDPEEFLNLLLHQILKAEPFLKLSSGQETYFYQLFVEKHEGLQVPTVQQLFDQSFLTSDIKLKEIPSCLIIQMPRFGKQFKTYNRIFPSLTLEITDVLEDSPRQCCFCGCIAEFECRECFYQFETPFTMKAFCSSCLSVVHSHHQRAGHNSRKIVIPEDFIYPTSITVPRVHMDLFAIVCIETSHYVAFVKCGSDPKAPWCFFDSMADRKGEQNGYNIPEVSFCPEVTEWLSEESAREVFSGNDIPLPERAKRLFGDAYMCMYQSSSAMMYN